MFSFDFEIKINPDKSIALIFNQNPNNQIIDLIINNELIGYVYSTSYLGAHWQSDGRNFVQTENRTSSL